MPGDTSVHGYISFVHIINDWESFLNQAELQNVSSRFESISSSDYEKKSWFVQFGHWTGISVCIVVSSAIGNRLPSQAFHWSNCLSSSHLPSCTGHFVSVDSDTVRVPIGMYSRQLRQGRSKYTAHMDMVHMGRFGSVRTLCGCVDMPCLLRVPWWQSFIPYLMEVLSDFTLSLRLFIKHLFIGFAMFLFVRFKAKYIW